MATVFTASERQARFVPEIWTSEIFMALEAELVIGSSLVVNRMYEGEIQAAGDTVRIPTVLDPTVVDYSPITGIVGDPGEIGGASLTFEIERSKMFFFRVEDITKVQSQIGTQYMPHGVQRAGRKLAEAADAWVAGKITAAITSAVGPNRYTEIDLSATGTPDKLYKQIVGMRVGLDKTNTPAQGRFMIVTPDVYGILLQDARFTDASKFGSSQPIRNGLVGSILGFNVVMCNVMPSLPAPVAPGTGVVQIIAGHNSAITYADQIVDVEYYRPEKFFADAVRGLHVYGAKVMRPEHLALGVDQAAA